MKRVKSLNSNLLINRGYHRIFTPSGYSFSKNFELVFNHYEQNKLLCYGKPNIFTDNRYFGGWRECTSFNSEISFEKYKSLKAIIRFCNNLINIVNQTLTFYIQNSCYRRTKKNNIKKYINCDYTVKSKPNSNKIENVNFEITPIPELFDNLKNEKLNNLITLLRNNGFLCYITDETDYRDDTNKTIYKQARCYGYGKEIGISDEDFTYNGYHNGIDNILWREHYCGEKWNHIHEISKSLNNEDILKLLMEKIGKE